MLPRKVISWYTRVLVASDANNELSINAFTLCDDFGTRNARPAVQARMLAVSNFWRKISDRVGSTLEVYCLTRDSGFELRHEFLGVDLGKRGASPLSSVPFSVVAITARLILVLATET